ncbi:CusA/CzcA family heavy metal efflux RND transporter [Myxococcota bacterium]|nr:CusA/CzcA family heavy metal efflux RND transporter [Myxococcota bacterium]
MSTPPPSGIIARTIAACAHHRWFTLLAAGALAMWGSWSARQAPLDAIPDLSDVQVIVFTEWMGRGPNLVEDQVTTPITSALLAAPHVKAVRGQSMFGMSFVYVIFDDDTDLYWARSRVLEYLNGVQGRLPAGVTPTLGPDATGVGWVYQYALVDPSGKHDLQELRSLQDWTVRYALESVPGVAQVASIGGFVKQYQVAVDPSRLAAYGVPLSEVVGAVGGANTEVGGRVLEIAEHEHVVRGRGYVASVDDIAKAPLLGVPWLSATGLPPATAGGTAAPAPASVGAAGMSGGMGATPSGGGMSGMGGGGGGASSPTAMGAGPSSGGSSAAAGLPLARTATPGQAGFTVRVGDVAQVTLGPDQRRGVADLDGEGNTVGGIVVMRQGENALDVIRAVKARIEEVKRSLPAGVEFVPTYDRSELIEASIQTLARTLVEELVVVSIVILVFLMHGRSALVPILALPLAVLAAFIPMHYQGLNANIMSLGGIAVAIGAMVDASIILVENVHKKLEHWEEEGRPGERSAVIVAAMQEVGPSAFFALLVITVSFLPIFTLEGTEGRLFAPLAWTKSWAMAFAALLAVTLTPALAVFFIRGRIRHEDDNPLNRWLVRLYSPVVRLVVRARWPVVVAAALAVASTVPVALRLGNEFMPPLNEGVILFMPTAPPGVSEQEAQRVLSSMDSIIKGFPEVDRVFGKMGRAETPTDPAPLAMAETVVTLKPREQWRPGVTWDSLIKELDAAVQVPGMPNAWWMPIQTRTEMLSTGIRSPLGIKVFGDSLDDVEAGAVAIEQVLKRFPGTRSAVAERGTGGLYADIVVDRDEAGRLGVSVAQVLDFVQTGIGGMNIGQTVEGRERYPIAVRFAREYRDDPDALARLTMPTPSGALVPLSRLAEVQFNTGPDMLRSDGGKLVGYVFVDTGDVPVADYVTAARPVVAKEAKLPAGTRVEWAGQFQYLERAKEKLELVVPLTLAAVALLLWLNTGSAVETGIVLLAVPFSLIGAVWLLWGLDYNMSVAVWVGIIALAGLDAETGVVMLLYLTLAHKRHVSGGLMRDASDLEDAIVEGAARRVRPKLMTVLCAMLGLLPVMWSDGTGADVMKRIAAPMVGGLVTSFLLELLVYPAIFAIWKGRGLPRRVRATA